MEVDVCFGMHDIGLLTTIAAAFAAAWVLGLITQAMKLSPIVGYLLAGVVIGPYTPGFVGDADAAHQLSELGVILLMFGVGLHFHLKDLLAVRSIAIPGAVVQSAGAIVVSILVFQCFGWPLRAGLVMGMAMAVASTVVLLRVLTDANKLETPQGHIAVGWLIVEDIFTVLMLVVIPMLATGDGAMQGGEVELAGATEGTAIVDAVVEGTAADPQTAAAEGGTSAAGGLMVIGWALLKLVALVAVVLLAGSRVVPWILIQVARLRSRELFTLTVLVLSIALAVGSSVLFGVSPALGAFLAGMVVGQSPVSHQAAAEALPMRDAFAVLFFVSVGMLVDPAFVWEQPWIECAALAVVLVVKPVAALLIVAVLGYSARTALTVAIGLAQIGEFSFILSDAARKYGLMPEEGHHALVAAAILSITLNSLLFRSIDTVERWLEKRKWLWSVLNARSDARMRRLNASSREAVARVEKPMAVIVGYGPVGRVVDAMVRDGGMETVVVDMNMDTMRSLTKAGRLAVFGDAMQEQILKQAGIERAVHLVVTLASTERVATLVMMARDLNPKLEVTVRARYLRDQESLARAGATKIVAEEGEAGVAMAEHVLRRRGVDEETIARLLGALRRLWKIER